MTDERLESLIGILLRLGVLTAAAVVAISGVLFVAAHHTDHLSYSTFQADADGLRTIRGILHGSMVGFYLEGDRLYLGVSLIVLTILLLSLIHSA
jgi:uncharacterized membrane protein